MAISSYDLYNAASAGFLHVVNQGSSSVYKCLRNIYEDAQKNLLSEKQRQEIDLLPDEIRQRIFTHIRDQNGPPSEVNLGRELLSSSPAILQEAIKRVTIEIFQQLDPSQQDALKSVVRNLQPLGILDALDKEIRLKALCSDVRSLIAELGKDADLLKAIPIFISKLEIKDQAILIEIAKLCAQTDGVKIVEFIGNFGINEESSLIEIAKLCAQNDPWKTALLIKNFGIQDQKALIEIARICAEKDGLGTADLIQNFDIQDEQARIDIARICAKQNGPSMAMSIQNFGIQDLKALIEIAKLCVQDDVTKISSCVNNFGIQDPDALIEMTKFCAQKNVWMVANCIESFGIKEESALIEIAMICAQENSWATAQSIKKFGIQDQQALIKIAKICAEKDGGRTSRNIRNFGIKDENALIEIAKICAGQKGSTIGSVIQNFGIQDQNALIEIINLSAQLDVMATVRFLQNFGIQDLTRLQHIWLLCILTSPDAISLMTPQTAPTAVSLQLQLDKLLNPLKHLNSTNPSFEELVAFLLESAKDVIREHIGQDSAFLEQVNCLGRVKDCFALLQASRWMASALFWVASLDPDQQKLMIRTDILRNLFSIQEPALRQNLSQLLFQFSFDQEVFKDYLDQSPKEQAKEKRILDLVLVSLQNSGVKKQTIEHIKTLVSPGFKGDVAIRPLLEMLFLLNKTRLLSGADKDRILQSLYKEAIKGPRESKPAHNQRLAALKPVMSQRVFALLAILLFNNEALLGNNSSIEDCAKATFQERLHLSSADNAFENFQKFFMTERNPHALITYAAKLFSLNEQAVMVDLGRYVDSVLNGTFSQKRYQLDSNTHLQTVSEYNPVLLEAWKFPQESYMETFSAKEEYPFDPRSWLSDKVERERHVPNNIPQLDALLRREAVKDESLLPVEKAVKNLLEAQPGFEQIIALKDLLEEIRNLAPCQLEYDVVSQLEVLNRNPLSLSETVHVTDTDDYLDLLLCGTEVVSSCQNVNHMPSVNKGLLGYMLDGKNRLIAIKNQSGQIMARAKLSILWDNDKPILFLESPYTQGKFTRQCLLAITKMAVSKAQSLGVPLAVQAGSCYCKQSPSAQPLGKPLYSLGGGVSYEYVDACEGIKKDGVYEIPADQIVVIA